MKNNKFSEAQYGAMRTGFLTAFPKIFTDIRYSSEIFSYMRNLVFDYGFSFQPSMFNNQMAVEIEARHKATSKVLEKYITPDTLVIEVACGLSPRRLEFEYFNYLEVDFQPVVDIKKDVYFALGKKKFAKSLVGVDLADTAKLTEFLSGVVNKHKFKKIIVVNEGLFWYLTKEQIATMTSEFVKAFNEIDWMWVTADCPTETLTDDEYRKVISSTANVKRGTFVDYTDFTKFFEELGLKNEKHKLSDFINYNDLSSAKLFSVEELDAITKINTYTNIAVLKKIK